MDVVELIHDLQWSFLPDKVRSQARRCLLDTIGTALMGRKSEVSRVIFDFAAETYGGSGARLWLDGRELSPPGAALAHGMTIDGYDMHDSCRPVKGHAGVALVPAAFATRRLESENDLSGQELLVSLVVGYEVAIRAGKALHATACDYHSSGAWNALGCAAITARRLGLSGEQTRHALGTAEYHGPRSQMMRAVDSPTMVKDGSGWGAMAGVSAALMAAKGFTGAPALTVESKEVADTWSDLGEAWAIMEQYFKPYAVCYWAQPAIAGALALQKEYNLRPEAIRRIRVYTFHEASRLAVRRPTTTEEAQYSLPFPVAMALCRGRVEWDELSGQALEDPLVLRLAEAVELIDDDVFNARFPAERLSRVEIEDDAGATFDSGEIRPLWDLSAPPSDDELRDKFRRASRATLAAERALALEQAIWECDRGSSAARIEDLLTHD